jgi:hypothetical protein
MTDLPAQDRCVVPSETQLRRGGNRCRLGQTEEIVLIVYTGFERRALVNVVRNCLVGKPRCEGQLVPLFFTSLAGEQTAGTVATYGPRH